MGPFLEGYYVLRRRTERWDGYFVVPQHASMSAARGCHAKGRSAALQGSSIGVEDSPMFACVIEAVQKAQSLTILSPTKGARHDRITGISLHALFCDVWTCAEGGSVEALCRSHDHFK